MYKITISSYKDLIQFIELHELDMNTINDLLIQTIGSFFINDYTKPEIITMLQKFVSKWEHNKEKPIFIDFNF